MTGGYVTSVLKDAFCVPRPFSPPVHRLSVGSHALEYGFPSTHSSNALSMALFFGELLLRRNKGGNWMVNLAGVVGLVLFAWSITFGRLYTGMVRLFISALWFTSLETLTQARYSVALENGRSSWSFDRSPRLACNLVRRSSIRTIGSRNWSQWCVFLFTPSLDRISSPYPKLLTHFSSVSSTGTLFIIPSLLLLVTFHPQPAENCPCFEDAIAFLSVFAGILLGVAWNPYKYADNTLGYQWRDFTDISTWSAAVVSKLVIGERLFPPLSLIPCLRRAQTDLIEREKIGVSGILVWRIVAKSLCHKALPPLFRLFAPVFALPRRYYLAATECQPLSRFISCLRE